MVKPKLVRVVFYSHIGSLQFSLARHIRFRQLIRAQQQVECKADADAVFDACVADNL
jgi:hypothetical protein